MIHPIEMVGAASRSEPVGGQLRAIDGAVVAISAFIVGVPVEGVVSQKSGVKIDLCLRVSPPMRRATLRPITAFSL